MSPTVFTKSGFRFYFFSREEPRIHIHVHHAIGEAKFWLEPAISLAQNYGLSPRRAAVALRLIREHENEIRTAWKAHLDAEVTNVSEHGFWLLLRNRELFVPFEHFPWFRDVSIGRLLHVELPQPHHLYWPELDVDLAVESIEHPERFPLVSKSRPNKPLQLARAARRAGKVRRLPNRARG